MVRVQGGISGLRIGGRTFFVLGLKDQLDGSSVRDIFEVSFTEDVKGAEKDIFEGLFRFSASVSRKMFDSTASEYQGAIGERSGRNF